MVATARVGGPTMVGSLSLRVKKNKHKQIAATQVLAIADQVVEHLSGSDVTPGPLPGSDAKKYIMALLGHEEGTLTSTGRKSRIYVVTASAKVVDPNVKFTSA